MLLEYLDANDHILDFSGQALRIKYDSDFQKNLDYHPDIVAITKFGHIVFFEVKSVTAMDNHINIKKYEYLEQYCKSNGFLYVMIDPQHNYMTFEELCEMPVIDDFLDMFEKWNNEPVNESEPYKHFNDEEVNHWYEVYGYGNTKKEFYLQVHSLIAYYRWHNKYKNGFMVYSRPVKLDKNNEVIDYI